VLCGYFDWGRVRGKALANRFALLSGFSGRADAALAERYQIEARLYDKDRREHRAAGDYIEG
jgi:hypothetical protein